MVSLNISETLLFNVGINVFSCLLAIIMCHRFRKDFAATHDIQLLREMSGLILAIILSDIAMLLMNGQPGMLVRVLLYADVMFYFILHLVVVLEWLRYAWYRIFIRPMAKWKEAVFVIGPFYILSLIIITAPWNGLCFYLDGYNVYHRGVLSVPMAMFVLAYLVVVSLTALTRYRKETLRDRRKELLTIAFITVPPFVGGLVQAMFYGITVIWPCAVISGLLVLFNKSSQAMSVDHMTGLFNRRILERYMAGLGSGQDRAVAVILMDINDFKSINDLYGHSMGDSALLNMARILRKTFNNSPAFLCRYGGDEFTVVLPHGDAAAAESAVRAIKSNVESFNRESTLPFPLSVSAGYAISAAEEAINMEALFEEADKNMYRDKEHYRQQKGDETEAYA